VQVAFFDWALKGQGEPGPAVRLFDLGSRAWRDLEALPAPEPTLWHLASSGLAATTTTDGRLAPEPAPDAADLLVHDPWRPAPAVGGHLGRPPGHVDRAAVDERSDVAVYTSAPLDRPLQLCGPVRADLAVTADRPAHDLHCSLSLVDGDGAARTLTTGHLRVPDAVLPGSRHVPMRAIACTAPAGTALRLSVQAAAWPAFAVNPGTGARPEAAQSAAAEVTTLAIAHGPRTPSTLSLPVVH
jgi:putative CocE/NonD family hydrolase